jgi:prophage maintenance system killer protein
MSETKYLTLQNIVDINNKIHVEALKDEKIKFGANSDNEIEMIEKLIECTPKNKSIIEVAAYYLKNIILLQAFSDGNHRTAFLSVLFFFRKNNYAYTYNLTYEKQNQFRNDVDKACSEVYGYSYSAMDTNVLNDGDGNKIFLICLDFIKKELF